MQWVLNCSGGKDDVRAGVMIRILGALEVMRREKICSVILLGDMRSDVLQYQHQGRTKGLGSFE